MLFWVFFYSSSHSFAFVLFSHLEPLPVLGKTTAVELHPQPCCFYLVDFVNILPSFHTPFGAWYSVLSYGHSAICRSLEHTHVTQLNLCLLPSGNIHVFPPGSLAVLTWMLPVASPHFQNQWDRGMWLGLKDCLKSTTLSSPPWNPLSLPSKYTIPWGPLAYLEVIWVLGIQTSIFTFVWQVLHVLSSPPSFLTLLSIVSWLRNTIVYLNPTENAGGVLRGILVSSAIVIHLCLLWTTGR